MPPMKQLALDIGLPTGPSLSRFYAGRNTPVVSDLQNWVNNGFGAADTFASAYLLVGCFWLWQNPFAQSGA